MRICRIDVRGPAVLVFLCAVGPAALAQSPAEAELRFSTGVMHLREGRVDLALEEFKKAAKEDPKNPYFQKGLGQALAAKRDWAAAISAFRRALELNPLYVDTRNDLGYALIMSGDRDAGKKEFLSAFSDPMNPAPEISAYNLGRAFMEEKNFGEASNWFRNAINRNKSYSAPYLLLAETLVATGRDAEAVALLEAGVHEAPNDPDLLLAMARAYLKVGRLVEGRTKLDEAVKADPSGPVGRAAADQLKSLPK
ncbi:MAG: tetratricopeptide repeat protein [Betaproteobacteria bacterium]